MARKRSFLGEDVTEMLRRNGGLFTVFTVLLIVATGIAIIDRPDRWWLSAAAIVVLGLVVFLFMNARVLVKATVAILLVLVMGSYGFRLGALMDPTGVSGTIWMTSLYSIFFGCLAGSFMWPSGKSRWGVLTASTVFGFASTFVMATFNIQTELAIFLGSVITVSVFFLWYRYGKSARFKADKMPIISMSEELAESLKNAAIESGRGGWHRKSKRGDSVVFWNEESAFQLVGVHMDQKFAAGGRKAQYLTYFERNINPWLLDLAYKMSPSWKTRRADIMLVMLDFENKNGSEPRVIGVNLPDSRKKIPVGILPAKHLLSDSKRDKLLTRVEEEFGDFVTELSESQLFALDSFLPEEESVEVTEEESTEESLKSV